VLATGSTIIQCLNSKLERRYTEPQWRHHFSISRYGIYGINIRKWFVTLLYVERNSDVTLWGGPTQHRQLVTVPADGWALPFELRKLWCERRTLQLPSSTNWEDLLTRRKAELSMPVSKIYYWMKINGISDSHGIRTVTARVRTKQMLTRENTGTVTSRIYMSSASLNALSLKLSYASSVSERKAT
jgi:hypothetical protein